MIPRSENFRRWFGTWFSDTSQEVEPYVQGCEQAPRWLAEGEPGFVEFRDELAIHIRDSSYPPPPRMSQWGTDEWLRDVWYDVFGPEPPPGDPYPVPADHWGRVRLTDYLLEAVGEDDEDSSDGADAWLEQRGLTHRMVYEAFSIPVEQSLNVRPQPDDYLDHLRRLEEAGLREPSPENV